MFALLEKEVKHSHTGYSPFGSGNLKLLSQNYETSQSSTGWGGKSDRANDGNTDGYWGAG